MSMRVPVSQYEFLKEANSIGSNRRAYARESTQELAELVVDLTGRKIICLVHNLSDGGAMVETSASLLPKQLILNYHKKNIKKTCRVVWLDGRMAGLEFMNTDI